MKDYKYPESTSSVLYICNAGDQISFGYLFSQIETHFGSAVPLSHLRIEYIRWTHEEPCGCCRDSGVYSDFYRIELVDVPGEYTPDMPIKELVID